MIGVVEVVGKEFLPTAATDNDDLGYTIKGNGIATANLKLFANPLRHIGAGIFNAVGAIRLGHPVNGRVLQNDRLTHFFPPPLT